MILTATREHTITIAITGRPAPKGSRIMAYTKAGKGYTRAASKFEAPWIAAVRDATKSAMRHYSQLPPPYGLDVQIKLAQPGRPSHEWPTKHDLDKLTRAVVDGLVKGGAMSDDRHVVELHTTKVFTDGPQGALVQIWHVG